MLTTLSFPSPSGRGSLEPSSVAHPSPLPSGRILLRLARHRYQRTLGIGLILEVLFERDAQMPAAEHLHELVPGSHLAVMEGYAHNAYYENWQGFNKIVRNFVGSL